MADKEPDFLLEGCVGCELRVYLERIERVVYGCAVLMVGVVEPSVHEVQRPAVVEAGVRGDHVDVEVLVLLEVECDAVELVGVDARREGDDTVGRVDAVECAVTDEAEFCRVKVEGAAGGG